jgi:hypothetical protein
MKGGEYVYASSIFKPTLASVLPLEQPASAHRHIEVREVFGNVILVPLSALEPGSTSNSPS